MLEHAEVNEARTGVAKFIVADVSKSRCNPELTQSPDVHLLPTVAKHIKIDVDLATVGRPHPHANSVYLVAKAPFGAPGLGSRSLLHRVNKCPEIAMRPELRQQRRSQHREFDEEPNDYTERRDDARHGRHRLPGAPGSQTDSSDRTSRCTSARDAAPTGSPDPQSEQHFPGSGANRSPSR